MRVKDYCWCDYHCYWNRFLDIFRGHIWMKPEPIYCIRCLKIRKTKVKLGDSK